MELEGESSGGRKRKLLNPALEDLSNVDFETSEDVEVLPTFDNIGLREDLLRGIYSYGLPSLPLLRLAM